MTRRLLVMLLLVIAPLSMRADRTVTYEYDEAGNRVTKTSCTETSAIITVLNR